MRTIHLVNSLAGGGVERSTALLVADLRTRGVDAHVIVLRSVGDAATEVNERIVTGAGGTVRQLSASTLRGRVNELRRILRAEDIDIVHTAIRASDLVGQLAGFGTRSLVVSSWISMPFLATSPGRFTSRRRRWSVNSVDALMCRLFVDQLHAVSDGVAAAYASAYRLDVNRIRVIERGRVPEHFGDVSTDRRTRVRALLDIAPDAEVVVSIGRLDVVKRHVDLVRAVGRLGDRAGLVCLVVGQEGTAAAQARAAIKASGLEGRIRLLGHRTDVAEILAASDVFVSTSAAEGSPGAIIEAMAMGVPIVSTDLAALQGVLVDDVTALLVPVGDVDALTRAARRLLDDKLTAQRLADRARVLFYERFTQERATDATLAMYRDLLER